MGLRQWLLVWVGMAIMATGRAEWSEGLQDDDILVSTHESDIPTPSTLTWSSHRDVRLVALGGYHSFLVTHGGDVYGWGLNFAGQLGLGYNTPASVYTPTLLSSLRDVKTLSAGGYHSLFLRRNGEVYATGMGESGQLGLGDQQSRERPRQIQGIAPCVSVAAGFEHSLLLTKEGKVFAWGSNEFGQLGSQSIPLGQISATPLPVDLPRNIRVQEVYASGYGSAVLTEDGRVYTWGWNHWGQLGRSAPSTRDAMPAPVENLYNVTSLCLGGDDAVALKSDGTIVSWGWNRHGQLCRWTPTDEEGQDPWDKPHSVASPDATPIRCIACGAYAHTLLQTEEGLYACGWNENGQLGVGDYEDRTQPARVLHLPSDNVILAAGFSHSGVLVSNGTVALWGNNLYGQAGSTTP